MSEPGKPKKPDRAKPIKTSAGKKVRAEKVDARGGKAFRQAEKKAGGYAKDPKRLHKLFEDATRKSKEIPRGPFKETWAYLMTMLRLMRAYASGRYREIPWQSLVTIIVAVIYFVSPVDFIPDFIPVIGDLDDALVVHFAIQAVKGDLDAFTEWEAANPQG
jgi:uncharacterized membrane protein YkvA (DUF1232 family)